MSARLLGQGWQGRGENACVPFVNMGEVGSALAICLVCAMGIHTTRRLSLCCVKMRAPCAHSTHQTLRIAGRGWHISGLVSGRCCYIDRCLGALVSLGYRKTLLQRLLPPFRQPEPGHPVLVVCRVCVYHQGRRLVYARHALGSVPSQQ